MKLVVFILGLSVSAQAFVKDTIPTLKTEGKIESSLNYWDDDCDSCGCSASGGSMGFGSLLNSNYIGIRYLYQSYRTNDGLYSNSPWFTERYNTVQLWSRLPITKKIQITALVPFHFHQRETVSGLQKLQGLGDITLLANYKLYQNLRKDSTTVVHTWQVGGGVKLPTGTFDQKNNGSINPGYQLGTGSWDYIALSEYTLRKGQYGLSGMANYTFKTENTKGYRFGDQFNYSGTFFYVWNHSNTTIAPQVGVNGEVYTFNYQHGQKLKKTAGNVVFAKLGFESGYKQWSLGCNLMIPLHQNLMAGNVEARLRLGLHLNYTL